MNNIILSYFGVDASSLKPYTDPLQDKSLEERSKGDVFTASIVANTAFADVAFPVDPVTKLRPNDLEASNNITDPALRNVLLANQAPISDRAQVDTTGMTDDEIAELVIPNGLHVSDLVEAGVTLDKALRVAENRVDPPVSLAGDVSEPSSTPAPSPTSTE